MEFVHPEDRPQAEIAALKLRSGIPVDHLEFRVSSKTGCRWLVGSATPAVDRQMAFAVVSDITERKYLDEQLRRQNVALEQQNRRMNEASRLKSEFLANMPTSCARRSTVFSALRSFFTTVSLAPYRNGLGDIWAASTPARRIC
jgi:hypothetical protein